MCLVLENESPYDCRAAIFNWWLCVNEYWKVAHAVQEGEHDQEIQHLPREPTPILEPYLAIFIEMAR